MSEFEKKFGKYALDNLPLVMIICYAIGYTLQLLFPKLLYFLQLNPYAILHRFQIWRLFTWVIIPPDSFGIFTLIMLYFYYSIGNTLSVVWGKYRFNLYIFSGLLFTILGAFALYGISLLDGSVMLWSFTAEAGSIYASYFSTYYINMSIFLAYAATFPDNQIFLFFFIPIKVKYLGVIYGAMLAYQFLLGASVGFYAICVPMLASLLNFIVFFLLFRKKIRFTPASNYGYRRSNTKTSYAFKKKNEDGFKNNAEERSTSAKSSITRHKCAICGKTDESDPTMQFRFCSKCNGNYEYCENHLFTHPHVK